MRYKIIMITFMANMNILNKITKFYSKKINLMLLILVKISQFLLKFIKIYKYFKYLTR
jgi:hypothetical protein